MKSYLCGITALLVTATLMCGCSADTQPVQTQTAETEQETTAAVTTTAETTTVTTTVTTEETTEYVPVLPEFEDTPENAYARLDASFTNADGGQTAPDDYAGVYSYFGKLYVCITTDEPSDFYTELLSEYTCIQYKKVNHSFNELQGIANHAYELLDGRFSVTYAYVDVPSNKAAIELAEGDPRDVRTYLESLDSEDFPVDILQITLQ